MDNPVRRAGPGEFDGVAGASFVDFDRDGKIDLWVAQYGYTSAATGNYTLLPSRLYKGDGTGQFFDVTSTVGLMTEDWNSIPDINAGLGHARGWSALACDLNGDGVTELLAASYGRAPNLLFQGALDPTVGARFTNRSVASGYAYDSEQDWTDNQFARCYCQANRSADGCANVPPSVLDCSQGINWDHSVDREPFRLGGNSATTVCADLDNDGKMDLLTTEIAHWWAGANSDPGEILLNAGGDQVQFSRPGRTTTGLDQGHPPYNWDEGWMTAAVFDFDNDGWPDLYIGASDYPGNHGLLYHQASPLHFEAVPIAQGIDHHRSHGIAVADFDHDGDLDVMVGHSLFRCDPTAPDDCYATGQVRFFENVIGDGGNWVELELVGGPSTNRSAIGARVTLTAGALTQTRDVGGGHGHYGIQHDLALHFGLGAACNAQVTIRWPDQALSTQSFDLVSGYRFRVVQGQPPEVLFPAP
jgi:hypothetical protein